jgi:hypothetical protein
MASPSSIGSVSRHRWILPLVGVALTVPVVAEPAFAGQRHSVQRGHDHHRSPSRQGSHHALVNPDGTLRFGPWSLLTATMTSAERARRANLGVARLARLQQELARTGNGRLAFSELPWRSLPLARALAAEHYFRWSYRVARKLSTGQEVNLRAEHGELDRMLHNLGMLGRQGRYTYRQYIALWFGRPGNAGFQAEDVDTLARRMLEHGQDGMRVLVVARPEQGGVARPEQGGAERWFFLRRQGDSIGVLDAQRSDPEFVDYGSSPLPTLGTVGSLEMSTDDRIRAETSGRGARLPGSARSAR